MSDAAVHVRTVPHEGSAGGDRGGLDGGGDGEDGSGGGEGDGEGGGSEPPSHTPLHAPVAELATPPQPSSVHTARPPRLTLCIEAAADLDRLIGKAADECVSVPEQVNQM